MKDDNIDISLWDNLGETYWMHRNEKQKWVHKYILFPAINNILNQSSFESLLDYGCGDGELLQYLSTKYINKTLVGFDQSKQMSSIAKKKHPNLVIKNTLMHSTYDFICMNMVIQDIRNPLNLLVELRDFLKDNGNIVITLPHPIFSLIESQHLTTSRIVKNKKGSKGIYRYLDEDYEEVYWNANSSNFTKLYNRTFFTYSKMFENAGYVIKNLFEPMPINDGICEPDMYELFVSIPKLIVFQLQ
ncbi:MAG: class I SAM-dependent methyltransferase [Oscillospiraceae bacterium]|nr:class I SAM-dependent methyltransferase [Oscillospiraceae bacterium]